MNANETFSDWSKLWLPRERLSLSQWAEKNFVLSPEYSAVTDLIRLFGWQREIFDSFTDPTVEKIVLKVGTQLVKTLFIQAAIAYLIAEQPGPTLLVQPKEDDAETFSRERLDPMMRDIPVLAEKMGTRNSRDKSNRILYKQFPNGSITLVGSIVPGNLARRSIQYLFGDETNKYPPSAGDEGSPMALAEERTVTFGTRKKIIYACSPTTPKAMISREYESSDQRQPWCKCWSCNKEQVLKWGQVRWDDDVPANLRPGTARYECEFCGVRWNEAQRQKAVEAARWIPSREFTGTRGFWISHLYSPHKTLRDMVAKWLKIKSENDVNELRVFVNTNLAEEWREKGEAPEWKVLFNRRQDYQDGIVPRGVLFLTAFADVQNDRLELEVKGWGRNRENWSVAYAVIQPTREGSNRQTIKCLTSEPEPWEALAGFLDTDWPCDGGGTMPIWAMGVDTGYRPQNVYDFCKGRPQAAHGPTGSRVPSNRTVVPTKGGDSAFRIIEGVSTTDAAAKRHGLKIVTIGTHAAKQQVYDALRIQESGPGYCHHPVTYDESYFQGVCAETRVVKQNGEVIWRKDGRNEPLDDHVGNLAMAELCGIGRFSEELWSELERRRENAANPSELPVPVQSRDTSGQPRSPQRPVRWQFGV